MKRICVFLLVQHPRAAAVNEGGSENTRKKFGESKPKSAAAAITLKQHQQHQQQVVSAYGILRFSIGIFPFKFLKRSERERNEKKS